MHLRRLFARLHLILKTLVEGGEDAVEASSANALSQALLFHIAQAKSGSAGGDRLRARFKLQERVPDRDVLVRARGAVTGRNAELYLSLGSAVRDELALVKDALDLELRTGNIEAGRRGQSHDALMRLKETVALDEAQMDAVTGLSGSGPAYVFLVIEALADAGVKVGLSRHHAQALAAQTLLGSAKLLIETNEHPGRLKDMVTSPGGTAIAGLHTIEAGGLRTTLMDAVEAAAHRAAELGRLA